MYAFLRYDARSGQRWLVVANLHRSSEFDDVHLHIPAEAVQWLGLKPEDALHVSDRLNGNTDLSTKASDLPAMGVVLPKVPALSAMYLEITSVKK